MSLRTNLPETARGRAIAAGAALVALIVVVALASSGGDEAQSPAPEEAAGEPPAETQPVSEAERQLDAMSIERRVGQLMIVSPEGTEPDDPVYDELEERGYAGLVLEARNYESPGQVEELADAAAEAAPTSPWVMAPQEGGAFNAFEGLPPERPPASIDSTREAAMVAEETAEALLELGVNGILAPVLDVGPVGGGAVGERAFSDIADRVTGYAIATVGAFEDAEIFSAAKHFPGLGAASQSTEQGPANVGLTIEQLAERDLLPFRAAIESGVPGIVVGHGLYGIDDFVTPASTSETVVSDLLREQLGFEGLVIADDVTAPAITATLPSGDAAVDAVLAGVDLVQVGGNEDERDEVYGALLDAVRSGVIPNERLDDAVLENLDVKRHFGVLEASGGD